MDDAGRRIQEIVDERNLYRADLVSWKSKLAKTQQSLLKLQEKQKNLNVHLEKLQEHGDELEEDCEKLQEEHKKQKAALKRTEERLKLKKAQSQNNEKQFEAQKKHLLKSADVADGLNTQLAESTSQIKLLLIEEARVLQEFRRVTCIWDRQDHDDPLLELKKPFSMETETTASAARLPPSSTEDRVYEPRLDSTLSQSISTKRALVDLSTTDSEDEEGKPRAKKTAKEDTRKHPAKRSSVSSPNARKGTSKVVAPAEESDKVPTQGPIVVTPPKGGKVLPAVPPEASPQFPSMRTTYTSAQEAAEDWFGFGSSSFAPHGGMLGLENAGEEWRAHFSRIESTKFLAIQRVAMCVAFKICQSKDVEWSKDEPFGVYFTHEEVLSGAEELQEWINERLLPNPRHGYLRGMESCLQVFSFHQ